MNYCRGLCDRYSEKTHGGKGIYRFGFKRCTGCGKYFDVITLEKLGFSTIRCPCCKLVLKGKPNKRKLRLAMEVANVQSV